MKMKLDRKIVIAFELLCFNDFYTCAAYIYQIVETNVIFISIYFSDWHHYYSTN